MSRLPDLPQNRTIFTFTLDSLHQENFHSEVAYKPANFFWGVALPMIKKLLEHSKDEEPNAH